MAIVIAVVALAFAEAFAGRPLDTEDTGTLDPGQVELELGLSHARDGEPHSFGAPDGPAFNIGLLPGLEGTLATGFAVVKRDGGHTTAGFGDTFMRLKYRLLDESPAAPALLGALIVRLPTGDVDRGLGEEGVDVQPFAAMSKTLGAVTLTLNAGYTFVTDDRQADVVNLRGSAEWQMSKAWALVGEVLGEVAAGRNAEDLVLVRAGTRYGVGERVTLDAAVAFGATRRAPDVVLTLGVTIVLN